MNVSPLIKEMVINGLLVAKMRTQPETKAGLVLYGLAGFLALTGIPFLAYAFYLWIITQDYVPYEAALYTTLALFMLAIVCGLIGHLLKSRLKRRRAVHHQDDMAGMIQTLLGAMEEELEGPMRDYPKTTLAAAAIAGMFAGKYLHQ
jgi:hypothetical protein